MKSHPPWEEQNEKGVIFIQSLREKRRTNGGQIGFLRFEWKGFCKILKTYWKLGFEGVFFRLMAPLFAMELSYTRVRPLPGPLLCKEREIHFHASETLPAPPSPYKGEGTQSSLMCKLGGEVLLWDGGGYQEARRLEIFFRIFLEGLIFSRIKILTSRFPSSTG